MSDLERVRGLWEDDPEAFIILRLQESSDPDAAHKAFQVHLKEDAARSAAQLKILQASEAELAALQKDYEEKADFFNRTYKLLDEKEAELASIREAVREHLERWECGGRLRQLIEEKE